MSPLLVARSLAAPLHRRACAVRRRRPVRSAGTSRLRGLVYALPSLALAACANVSTDPEELRRTWDAALVRVLHGDHYVFGTLGGAAARRDLAKLPPQVRLPTVIYLHGCAGTDLGNQGATVGRLLKAGFAVIAPDSFALTHRQSVCGRGSRHVFSVRAAEASYAAQQARALPWVDAGNLFLVGFSEGGAGAAAFRGDQFNAIVIAGFSCADGIGSRTPTLAVAYSQDDWLHGKPVCPGATARLIVPGASHHILREDSVADRVLEFLKSHLRH